MTTVRFAMAAVLLAGTAGAVVTGMPVEYKEGGKKLEGWVAVDDAVKGPRPGVLIVHEWRGMNDYVRGRAKQLAALGYVAFAADIYGKGVYAKDHEEAGRMAGMYRNDRARMRARAHAGLEALRKQPNVDVTKLAAIGYCFGGTTVLEMARAGEDLKGVVSFHGALDTPTSAARGAVKAKVLVCQGGADAWTLKTLPDFEKEMDDAGADWQVAIYGGAVHSFTVSDAGNDPSKGMAYNEAADHRSFTAMEEFLEEVFGIADDEAK